MARSGSSHSRRPLLLARTRELELRRGSVFEHRGVPHQGRFYARPSLRGCVVRSSDERLDCRDIDGRPVRRRGMATADEHRLHPLSDPDASRGFSRVRDDQCQFAEPVPGQTHARQHVGPFKRRLHDEPVPYASPKIGPEHGDFRRRASTLDLTRPGNEYEYQLFRLRPLIRGASSGALSREFSPNM